VLFEDFRRQKDKVTGYVPTLKQFIGLDGFKQRESFGDGWLDLAFFQELEEGGPIFLERVDAFTMRPTALDRLAIWKQVRCDELHHQREKITETLRRSIGDQNPAGADTSVICRPDCSPSFK
jgi:hypothetical protein